MTADARFEDAAEPLRLKAESAEDLAVIAAVLQDAVGLVGDAAFLARRRRFAAVLNRFRWEDHGPAKAERVRAGLSVENVRSVRARGFDPSARARPYSVLDLAFDSGEDGAGTLRMVLAGGAQIAFDVEALEVTLQDMSQPWPAQGIPSHDG
jgi:hypothetical protein